MNLNLFYWNKIEFLDVLYYNQSWKFSFHFKNICYVIFRSVSLAQSDIDYHFDAPTAKIYSREYEIYAHELELLNANLALLCPLIV